MEQIIWERIVSNSIAFKVTHISEKRKKTKNGDRSNTVGLKYVFHF